jgi:hypothetical protein
MDEALFLVLRGRRETLRVGLAGDASRGAEVASKQSEDITMPTTHHSAAAERHLQAAHAHQAAAASHNQNDHAGAHEQSKLALEHSREAHKLSEELVKHASETIKS